MAPFEHRPNDPEAIDWEDNPVSNSLAWMSEKVTCKYCKSPEHWTSKLTNYFWTDCSCCLFLRGVIVGIAVGAVLLYVFDGVLTLAYNLLKGF